MNPKSLDKFYRRLHGRLSPQTGRGFELSAGERLRVLDPEGQQVSDLFCFDREDPTDALSSGRSIDYNDTIALTRGHFLYAQSGQILLEILEDTCGRHDFLVTPCSRQMFRMLAHDAELEHPSCENNLWQAFANFPVNPRQITTSFNIFMNIPMTTEGAIHVDVPTSRAGDFIIFEAKRNLYVGLTACSDEGTNNGRCKPIDFEVWTADHTSPLKRM